MRATSLVVCLLNFSLVVGVLLTAPCAASMGASQAMADFTGRWMRVDAPRDSRALEPHEPDIEEIQQSGNELQLTKRWPGRSKVERHIADGQERDDESQPGSGARLRTTWEDGRLVTTRRQSVTLPHGATEAVVIRLARWLEADRMIVEITWSSERTTVTRRIAYRREVQ